jgi:hypothetical protein
MADDFAVNVLFAYSPSNQLGVLRTKVQHQDPFSEDLQRAGGRVGGLFDHNTRLAHGCQKTKKPADKTIFGGTTQRGLYVRPTGLGRVPVVDRSGTAAYIQNPKHRKDKFEIRSTKSETNPKLKAGMFKTRKSSGSGGHCRCRTIVSHHAIGLACGDQLPSSMAGVFVI